MFEQPVFTIAGYVTDHAVSHLIKTVLCALMLSKRDLYLFHKDLMWRCILGLHE